MDTSELYRIYCQHPVVTTDTRHCPAGSIFFALRGERFNGNLFATQALEAGCAYAVVDDAEVAAADSRCLLVPDVLTALQQLAHHHRRQLGTRIVQVTGTNGKTTTKELTAAVLAERLRVLYTQGNLNNHIGVPLTLLRLTKDYDVAVVETGANHPGEIATLSRIVDADMGLITNVGKAHLEGFGSFEGVVRTKGELYDYLRAKPQGLIFLQGDNPHLRAIAGGLAAITYGSVGHGYNVEGEVIGNSALLCLRFRVNGGAWQEVQTHLIGAYNLDNVLAAVAVGAHLGVSPAEAAHAIAHYRPTNNRSELRQTGKNSLIVDAYNANPTSMRAALDNFGRMAHAHKMAILGEMKELGPTSREEHAAIADLLPQTGCEEVWLVGHEFEGLGTGSCRHFANVEEVKAALQEQPVEGRLILIKGSNSTHLFQLPDLL